MCCVKGAQPPAFKSNQAIKYHSMSVCCPPMNGSVETLKWKKKKRKKSQCGFFSLCLKPNRKQMTNLLYFSIFKVYYLYREELKTIQFIEV